VRGAFYLVGDGDFDFISTLTDTYLVRKAAREGYEIPPEMLFASLPFLPLVFSGMGFIFSKSDFQGMISSNMLCVSSRDFCGGRLAGGLGLPGVIYLCFLAGRV
jgi:hypothetical protein